MTPLLSTLTSLVLPDHSSKRYTPPLIVAIALTCTGELTVAFSAGEQTWMPLPDGIEHELADWLTTTSLMGDAIE